MIRIKLVALEHPSPEVVDVYNRSHFANTVLWLEDQKIRHYKIEDRENLRKVDNLAEWEEAYTKYKADLKVPDFQTPVEEISWLLSYAVRLEYLDDADSYKSITSNSVLAEMQKSKAPPKVVSTNPIDSINMQTKEFEAGVRNLANQLEIAYHPDHLLTLEAIARLIRSKLRPEAFYESMNDGNPYPIHEGERMAFEEPELEQAAKILRLLQIQSLRELQTAINETIVAVQDITADPKTDTKLGKVGF